MKAFLSLILLTCLACAQDVAKKNDPPAKGAEAKIDLNLTPIEIEIGQKAQRALQDAALPLNKALQDSQTIRTDEQASALMWKLKSFFGDLLAADKEYKRWIDGLRKDHKCPNCDVNGTVLVPPPTEKTAKQ